jgi:hypothetical protein
VHPWPHEDGSSLEVVEGWPCRGVVATAVIVGVVIVVSFALLLVLAFTLTLVFHLNLIEFEVVVDDVEGEKGLRADDEGLHMIVLLVQTL